MDDKTHGDGGDRAGRTERTVLCGYWDDGECIGKKSATHSMSLVGGSNAKGEPIVPFVSLMCESFDTEILKLGPVAKINGKEFGTQGICNSKGSVNGDGAIRLLYDSIIPSFNAHGTALLHCSPWPQPQLTYAWICVSQVPSVKLDGVFSRAIALARI